MVYFTDEFENLFREFRCVSKNPFKLELTDDMIKVSYETEKTYYDEYDRPYDDYDEHVIYFGLEKTHFSTPSATIRFSPNDAILVHVNRIPPSKSELKKIKLQKYQAYVERKRFRGMERELKKKLFSLKYIPLETRADMLDRVRMKIIYLMEPRDRRGYFELKKKTKEKKQGDSKKPLSKGGRQIVTEGNRNIFKFGKKQDVP